MPLLGHDGWRTLALAVGVPNEFATIWLDNDRLFDAVLVILKLVSISLFDYPVSNLRLRQTFQFLAIRIESLPIEPLLRRNEDQNAWGQIWGQHCQFK